MKEILIVITIACFLYSMRNLIGLITRLFIYGMMAYTLFSDVIKGWDTKLFSLALLAIPVIVNLLLKYVKYKMLKT